LVAVVCSWRVPRSGNNFPKNTLPTGIFLKERPVNANRAIGRRTRLALNENKKWQGRIALLIDGPNFLATAKVLGFDIDYKRLLNEFQGHATLLRAYYFTPTIEDQEYSSLRPLIDWLDYNGYTVVTKIAKQFTETDGRRKVKASMGIELAVYAMEIAEHVDQIVLFSGDADFRHLTQALQRRGVRVIVISTISSEPPMISNELRRQADIFIDLMELRSRVSRNQ
jgi:uncharacterized LabA/DUF88 family protein